MSSCQYIPENTKLRVIYRSQVIQLSNCQTTLTKLSTDGSLAQHAQPRSCRLPPYEPRPQHPPPPPCAQVSPPLSICIRTPFIVKSENLVMNLTMNGVRLFVHPGPRFQFRAIPCFDGLDESFRLRYRTTSENLPSVCAQECVPVLGGARRRRDQG